MNYEIDKEEWHKCKLCKKTIVELAKIYGGTGIYYSQVFKKHIKNDHEVSIEKYFEEICKIKRPTCECINEECNKKCHIYYRGKSLFWKRYVCGLNADVFEWSKNAKRTRKGAGNPMYGKSAWNKGKVWSEETRKKMRSSALKRINEGRLKTTRTKPHIKFLEILEDLKIEYREEETSIYWSFDFYLPKYNIFVEIDGDFYHSNPKIYPDGPTCFTQRKIKDRDIRKTKYCKDNNMNLLRFWESDILYNNQKIKKDLLEYICKLKK